MSEQVSTFIIDCPICEEKVAAIGKGKAEEVWEYSEESRRTEIVVLGQCPDCNEILVGKYYMVFEDNSFVERSDIVRVFPKPLKTFHSNYIPSAAESSLEEANRCLQVKALRAACVMFGRALEAVCAHKLGNEITLALGLKELYNRKIIDARLFEWSEHLRAFRNLAAHANNEKISRQDAEDLQVFVYAIIEYVYDLTERFEEFINRISKNP